MKSNQDFIRYQNCIQYALKSANTCIFELDTKKRACIFSENVDGVFGASCKAIIHNILTSSANFKSLLNHFCHPDDTFIVSDAFQKACLEKKATCNARLSIDQTGYIWFKIDFSSPTPNHVVAILTDISEIKELTESLRKEVILDSFTKLYNKVNIQKFSINMLRAYPNQKHALILIDLDDFKVINDRHGHIAGDQVLKSVSEHLKQVFSHNAMIGRFGGDEFLVFLRDICEEILFEKLQQLRGCDDNAFRVTKSIGVALYPDHGRDFTSLIKKADVALYKSKRMKDAYSIYSNEI